jgi:hypothetical protein
MWQYGLANIESEGELSLDTCTCRLLEVASEMAKVFKEYNVLEIEVLGESQIEIIPTNWWNKDGNTCKWPNSFEDEALEKAIEQCVPPDETWLECEVGAKPSINIGK